MRAIVHSKGRFSILRKFGYFWVQCLILWFFGAYESSNLLINCVHFDSISTSKSSALTRDLFLDKFFYKVPIYAAWNGLFFGYRRKVVDACYVMMQ